MKQVTELRRLLSASAWAIQPEALASMRASLELIASGGAIAEHTLTALKAQREIEAARRQSISASTGGAVVVLPLYGVISQRFSLWSYYFGGTSTEGFTMQFRQALADPNVQAIVIDVDSPGGAVSGVDELASEIYAGRSKKKIIALSDTLNASAAYYVSSQASELYVMPSSLTGSIGVYSTHEDDSALLEQMGVKLSLISAGKYKVEGNSFEPLTDEARAAMQKMVDGYYGMFVKAVARGRGVKQAAVLGGFGEGRVLMAADAISAGLADGYGTLDSVLAKFGVARPADGGSSYATTVEAPDAETNTPAGETEAAAGKTEAAAGETEAAAGETPAPEAAKKATKADELDDNDGNDEDKDGSDDGDEDLNCKCDCQPCQDGDHVNCSADPKCDPDPDAKTKAAAEHQRLLALESQRIAVKLAL